MPKSVFVDQRPCVIDLKQTWDNLLLAARIIAGVHNPKDICVVSSNPKGTRAVLKFSHSTGAFPIASRYTPGTLTNQIQKAYIEPRILVVADPLVDHRIVRESAYAGISVIAFCNSNATLKYVDLVIPCNSSGPKSIGLMWWMLAREVLRFRGHLDLEDSDEWDVMPDLFMYRISIE
ncbi:LOW QUALITY PROTEIN: small ribosomal subunit protein uS2-like, partial [Pempheris klunzingeri]|uniref:LOW QUALITY PROTEIN: small ribosomal subunit protein uS2-like n=1 Tax=Pempheris klunzingeri TaxID=3127111 RepID=UPI00397F34E5